METPLISVGGLWKVYGSGTDRVEALRGVTTSCRAGASLAVSGDAGAGKSTLIRLLALDEEPSRGWIDVNGVDVWALSRRRRRQLMDRTIAVLRWPDLTGSRSTLLDLLTRSLRPTSPSPAERRRRAMHLLERCDLTGSSLTSGRHLTPEQRQRAALALTIGLEPRLILVDEPSTASGPSLSDVLDSLLTLNREQGVALVLATNDQEVARRCDRHIFLYAGEIRTTSTDAARREGR